MASNEPGQPLPVTSAGGGSTSIDLDPPSSALAIGAHPDDVEFGCGATLAKWAAAGCTVHHLVCTDGSKGTWDPHADVVALAKVRQDEQREAARRLALDRAGEVRFLGVVDGELDSGVVLRSEVARTIRELRPEVVLGHDPWKRYRLHPDHRHAGWLACDSVVAARDPHFFRDHDLPAHRPQALLLWEADEPDHVERVGDFVDRKLEALAAHESQFESTMGTTNADLTAFEARIRARLQQLGEDHGVDSAEVFKLVSGI